MECLRSVRLESLNEREYDEFVEHQVRETAHQETLAGHWREEEALDRARKELVLLIGGEARRIGHRFFKVVVRGTGRIGWIWEGPPPPALGLRNTRWLYQITVEEGFRGRGFGGRALRAVEEMLRREGVDVLRLNVNLWNRVAIALYESSGYTYAYRGETDANLHKRLR